MKIILNLFKNNSPQPIDSYEKAYQIFDEYYQNITSIFGSKSYEYPHFIISMGIFKKALLEKGNIKESKGHFDAQLANLNIDNETQEIKDIIGEFKKKYHSIKFENFADLTETNIKVENPEKLVNELNDLLKNTSDQDRITKGIEVAIKLFGINCSINDNGSHISSYLSCQKKWLNLVPEKLSTDNLFWLNPEVYALIVKNPTLESYFWDRFSHNVLLYQSKIYPSIDRAKKILFQNPITDQGIISSLLEFLKERKETISGDEYFKFFLNLYQPRQKLDSMYFLLAKEHKCSAAILINSIIEKVKADDVLDLISDSTAKKSNAKNLIVKFFGELCVQIQKLNLTTSQTESLWAAIRASINTNLKRHLERYVFEIVRIINDYTTVYHMYIGLSAVKTTLEEESILFALMAEIAKHDMSGRTDYLLSRYYLEPAFNQAKLMNDDLVKYYHENALKKNYPLAALNEISYLVKEEYPYQISAKDEKFLKRDQDISLCLNIMQKKLSIMLLYFVDLTHLKIYNELNPKEQFPFTSSAKAYEIALNSSNDLKHRISAIKYLRTQIQIGKEKILFENPNASHYYTQLLSFESKSHDNHPELIELLMEQLNVFRSKKIPESTQNLIPNFSIIDDGIKLYEDIKNGNYESFSNINDNSSLMPSLPSREKIELTLEAILNKIKFLVTHTQTQTKKEKIEGALWLANLYMKTKPIRHQTDRGWDQEFQNWHFITLNAKHPRALLNELWCLGKRAHHKANADVSENDRKLTGQKYAKQLFSITVQEDKTPSICQDEWLMQVAEFPDVFWLNTDIYKLISDRKKEMFWLNLHRYYENCFALNIYPSSADDYFKIFLNTYEISAKKNKCFEKAVEGKHDLAMFINHILTVELPSKQIKQEDANQEDAYDYQKHAVKLIADLYFKMSSITLSHHKQVLFQFMDDEIRLQSYSILRENSTFSEEVKKLAKLFLKIIEKFKKPEFIYEISLVLSATDKEEDKNILLSLLKTIAEMGTETDLIAAGRANYLLHRYYLKNVSSKSKTDNDNSSKIHFDKSIKYNHPLALADHLILLVKGLNQSDILVSNSKTQLESSKAVIKNHFEKKISQDSHSFTIILLYFVIPIKFFQYYRLTELGIVKQENFLSALEAFSAACESRNDFNKLSAALEYLSLEINNENAEAAYYLSHLLRYESESIKNFPEVSVILEEKSHYLRLTAKHRNCSLWLMETMGEFLDKMSNAIHAESKINYLMEWRKLYAKLNEIDRNRQKIDSEIILNIKKSLTDLWINLSTDSNVLQSIFEIDKTMKSFSTSNDVPINDSINELITCWETLIHKFYFNIRECSFRSIKDGIGYYELIKRKIVNDERLDKTLTLVLSYIISLCYKWDVDMNLWMNEFFSDKKTYEIAKNYLLSDNIPIRIADSLLKTVLSINKNITAAEYFQIAVNQYVNCKLIKSEYFDKSCKMEHPLAIIIKNIFEMLRKNYQILKQNTSFSELEENPRVEIINLIGQMFVLSQNVNFKFNLLISHMMQELTQVSGNEKLVGEVYIFLKIIHKYPTLPDLYEALISNNSLKDYVLKLLECIAKHEDKGAVNYLMFKYYQRQVNDNNALNLNNPNKKSDQYLNYYQKAVTDGFPLTLIQELIALTNTISSESDKKFFAPKAGRIYERIINSDIQFSCLIIYLTSIKDFTFFQKFSKLINKKYITPKDAYAKICDSTKKLESKLYALCKLVDQMHEKNAAAPYYLAKIIIDQKNSLYKDNEIFFNEIKENITKLQEMAVERGFGLAIIEKMNALVAQLPDDLPAIPAMKILSDWLIYSTKLSLANQNYQPFPIKLITVMIESINHYWKILVNKNSSDYSVAFKELTEMSKIINTWKNNNFIHSAIQPILKVWDDFVNEYPSISTFLAKDELNKKYHIALQLKKLVDKTLLDISSSPNQGKKELPLIIKKLGGELLDISLLDEEKLNKLLNSLSDELKLSNKENKSAFPSSLKEHPALQNFYHQLTLMEIDTSIESINVNKIEQT